MNRIASMGLGGRSLVVAVGLALVVGLALLLRRQDSQAGLKPTPDPHEPNDRPAQATPANLPAAMRSEFWHRRDVDWIRFVIEVPSTVRALAWPDGVMTQVCDALGRPVTGVVERGHVLVRCEGPTGEYRVRIECEPVGEFALLGEAKNGEDLRWLLELARKAKASRVPSGPVRAVTPGPMEIKGTAFEEPPHSYPVKLHPTVGRLTIVVDPGLCRSEVARLADGGETPPIEAGFEAHCTFQDLLSSLSHSEAVKKYQNLVNDSRGHPLARAMVSWLVYGDELKRHVADLAAEKPTDPLLLWALVSGAHRSDQKALWEANTPGLLVPAAGSLRGWGHYYRSLALSADNRGARRDALLQAERYASPQDARLRRLLAHQWRWLGDLDRAERLLCEALDVSPLLEAAHWDLADVYRKQERFGLAATWGEILATLTAGANYRQLELAKSYVRIGLAQTAGAILTKVASRADWLREECDALRKAIGE